MALAQTLTDTFDTGLDKATKWGLSSAGTVWDAANQRVQVPCTKPTSSILAPSVTYDLTSSYVFAKITRPATGNGTRVIRLITGDGGSNSLDIRTTGTALSAVKNVAGVVTQQALGTYSATTHAFWRIRESGGTAFFDTSTNGLTWTNRWSTAKGINVTALYPYVECYYTGTESATNGFVDYFSQLHTVDYAATTAINMGSTPVQSETIPAVVTTQTTVSSTPVQSETITQAGATPLALSSTALQSEIITHNVTTDTYMPMSPIMGFAGASLFGMSADTEVGFSPITNLDQAFADVIDNNFMTLEEQVGETLLSYTSTLTLLHQGGQELPYYVQEYLTTIDRLKADKPYRLIAQRILDRVFLDWDLPVSDVVISYTLSGPKLIKGKLAPELLDFLDLGLEPKATFIHIEQDGIIRGSAILQPSEINDDGSLTFVAEGISGYPHGQPYQGEYAQTEVDPLSVVRDIWTHLLASPRANLGLTIGGATSPKRIGTELDETTNTIRPYTLLWWDDTDCGQEIDSLARDTPFDYVEHDVWNSTKTDVEHYILPAYPRTGSRRFDLSFVSGENILSVALLREEPNQYASEVIVRGAGEGKDSIRGFAANIIGNRIRQSVSVTDRTITSFDVANARASAELRSRQAFLKLREVTILDRHGNASLGDFSVGDDILVQVELYWFGEIQMWCRIIGYDWTPGQRAITIQLENSEVFDYGIENRIELS